MALRPADAFKDPADLIIVGLDTSDGQEHPLWDARITTPISREMVNNIIHMGVKQPVSVRQDGDKFYVVDGRQRVRNARVAADEMEARGDVRVQVPIWMDHGSDEHLAQAVVVYNEFRHDDSPLDRALRASRLFNILRSHDKVALQFGVSTPTIRTWLSVAEAHPSLHTAIREGKISFSVGSAISNHDRPEQMALLEKELTSQTRSGPVRDRIPPKRTHLQKGVTRSWVRKALKTKAFESLSSEKKELLKWIALGETEKDSWIENLVWDVEKELESKAGGGK